MKCEYCGRNEVDEENDICLDCLYDINDNDEELG